MFFLGVGIKNINANVFYRDIYISLGDGHREKKSPLKMSVYTHRYIRTFNPHEI
jgi:hypothetical protein